MPLLEIRNLSVAFATRKGPFVAVDGLDLLVEPGQIIGVVGESGSGKSVGMLAVLGLLPWTATVTADMMRFDGRDLLTLGARARRKIIGKDLAMIFQEPMSSLNPCFPVGWQIAEALKAHEAMGGRERKRRVVELLAEVGIPEPEKRARAFPHQLSGGMSQRVMIAMALACRPKLLIADEPTTALDVTIQAQILDLIRKLRDERGMGVVLITHDMGVVAEAADQVIVQYAARQVERSPAATVFSDPHHPYTAALLAALPERAKPGEKLPAIAGIVPGAHEKLPGCVFAPRCNHAVARCMIKPPPRAEADLGFALCHTPLKNGQRTMARDFQRVEVPL
jgi:dipeptide transport system ATP-binding protein